MNGDVPPPAPDGGAWGSDHRDGDRPIVVGVDGSRHAERALRWAVREAQLRRAPLTLVHVYVEDGVSAASAAGAHELAQRLVDDVLRRHRHLIDELTDVETIVMPGSARGAAAVLLDAGHRAQLVVLGTRGLGGFSELLLGSTSHRVLMHASVPVVLVRTPPHVDPTIAEEHDGRRPLVVGVDQSAGSQAALRWAFDEACRRDVGVLAVHALDAPSAPTLRALGVPVELVASRLTQARSTARQEVDEQIDRALPTAGRPRLDRLIDDGAPVSALLRYATPEHLLVVGTRGRRGFAELGPGSVSHQCAHHVTGPMVAVPSRPPATRA
ncbi:MAG TPA: universal stress protein [Euzebyales bacterium]